MTSHSKDPTQQLTAAAETTLCPHCGRKLATLFGAMNNSKLPLECSCDAAVAERAAQQAENIARLRAHKERKVAELMEKSGIPSTGRVLNMRAFTLDTEERTAAYQRAVEFVQRSKEPGAPAFLYIHGDIGTGKTRLAMCLAADLVRRTKPVTWTRVSDILRELRDAMNDKKAKEADIVAQYTDCPWLFLDDLGEERPSEWTTAQLYNMLDERYANARPTVITSNYTLSQLERALTATPESNVTARSITDRIGQGIQISLTGKSRRHNHD